ncbi:isoprenylcysteine carboxylmethyltransferase family protein [Mesonia sp. HuA40]|uniref:methyltransferase family protein n=1 Tax=Mesonia sp. HuA40 TaxID=2602761 RepID=UPI0011C7EE7B|nr:hypothetical protein FT993_04660 [Mesonia sp. HuA40]
MLFKILKSTFVVIGVLMRILGVLQLGRNLSPSPTLVAGDSLIQTGPYKCIKHPIYTSILLIFLGYGL